MAQSGFPTRAMVGHEGVSDAWLLTQHADTDPKFQKQILAVLESRPKDEVLASDLALLVDRVLVREGRPQRYGSHFAMKDGRMQPDPVEDPAHLDARRAQIHLMPMADYTCVMQHLYAPKH